MVVCFLSDYGWRDDFVGTCHGVIARLAPATRVIDVTHGIAPQAVLQGALVLANTLPYVPSGCIWPSSIRAWAGPQARGAARPRRQTVRRPRQRAPAPCGRASRGRGGASSRTPPTRSARSRRRSTAVICSLPRRLISRTASPSTSSARGFRPTCSSGSSAGAGLRPGRRPGDDALRRQFWQHRSEPDAEDAEHVRIGIGARVELDVLGQRY